MAKLTEGMVIGRTRAADLASVRKLNCWGSDIGDVSLVRQMKFVEVLSLSVNKITTLIDFAYCPNLQELYIRKNQIRDLSEILYLKDLPKLWSLWLEDNPCSTGDRYRLTVLKYLPNLKKLDNIEVQPDELRDAMRYGAELEHPSEKSQFPVQSPTSETNSTSSAQTSTPSPPHSGFQGPPVERDNEFDSEGNVYNNYGTTSPENHYQPEAPEKKPYGSSRTFTTSVTSTSSYTDNDSRSIPREMNHPVDYSPSDDQSVAKINRRVKQETVVHSNSFEKDMSFALENYEQSSPVLVHDHRPPQQQPPPPTMPPPSLPMSNPLGRERDYHDVMHQHSHPISTPPHSHQTSHMVHSDGYGDVPEDHDPRYREDAYRYTVTIQQPPPPPPPPQMMHPSHQNIHKHHLHGQQLYEKILDSPNKPYPTRPKNRNSNILSAVLCLIKELDCASLEVVEMAVRCRMEELDD